MNSKVERTMNMKKRQVKVLGMAALLAVAIFVAGSSSVLAVETVTLPLEVYGEDVVSVVFPTVREDGDLPFNFIMDPQRLLYETGAVKYGGGIVEEGATLLFRNHEREYDFSGYSDQLTIRNQSNVPVIVTVTASISNLGEVEVVGSPDFGESKACSLYLALVDDRGNELPVLENGEISVNIEMRQAPDYAYAYWIDEETGSYTYELCGSPEEIDFDSYSFGLKGCCNSNGEWRNIAAQPSVQVMWKIEPVLSGDSYSDTMQENADNEEDTDVKSDADIEKDIDVGEDTNAGENATIGKDGDMTVSGMEFQITEDMDTSAQEGTPGSDTNIEDQNPEVTDVENQETADEKSPNNKSEKQGEAGGNSENDMEDVSANEIKINMGDGEGI